MLVAAVVQFSRRTAHDSEPQELVPLWQDARCSPRAIDWTVSNPTRVGIKPKDGLLAAAIGQRGLADYAATSFGPLHARTALAERMCAEGSAVPADRLFLTASTSEAYSLLFKLLCDPGDDVLVAAPTYPLLPQLAEFEAVSLNSFQCVYAGAWCMDIADLKSRITPRTKAIVLVSPNNPTGHCLSSAEFEALLDLDIPLIVDEVFDAYLWSPAATLPARGRSASRSLVFSLHGLSKYALLPQMKLAWTTVAGEAPLVHEALRRLDLLLDAYLSVGAGATCGVTQLLEVGDVLRSRALIRIRNNLAILDQALQGTPITRLTADGGFTACLRLPNMHTGDAYARALISNFALLAYPGSFYGLGNTPHLVVSLLIESKLFAEATLRLVECTAMMGAS
jgi:alanine-synthesizing transaminase